MASDAHAHPYDLRAFFPEAEGERRRLGVVCAASAWNREQFEYHESLAAEAGPGTAMPRMALCFAVHPQLPVVKDPPDIPSLLSLLENLAGEGRLNAVGETGFDYYDENYRRTGPAQEELFRFHLEIALKNSLPLVLHVRRAMDKIFAESRILKRLPAVVFHSYSGTPGEGGALLRRGISAYFSFGNAILLNHKAAMAACASLPPERLLFETDAPYQALRGKPYSSWADLSLIRTQAAALRSEAGKPGNTAEELEEITDRNFSQVFFSEAPQ